MLPIHQLFAGWRKLLVLVLLAGASLTVQAQTPGWQNAVRIGNTTTGTLYVTATAPGPGADVYLAGRFSGTVSFGSQTLYSSSGSEDGFVGRWSPTSGAFVWVKQVEGPGREAVTALAVTPTGLYFGGDFSSPFVSLDVNVLRNAGGPDGFVAKLTESGASSSIVWAEGLGGPMYDHLNGLAVSGASVYAAGTFESLITLGSIRLTSPGLAAECFVAKLTDAGPGSSFTWATSFGSLNDDLVGALTLDGPSLYVVGSFRSTATFGPTTLPSAGGTDIFVTKLTDTGPAPAYAWTRRAGSPADDDARALAVQAGSVYVVGALGGPGDFGSTALTPAGSADLYAAKLTDAGSSASFTWAYGAGSAAADAANAVAVRGTGVYVAGQVGATVSTFGSQTLLTTGGGGDVFVTRLTDAGPSAAFTWVQWAGGPYSDYAAAVVPGPGPQLYVSGSVIPPAAFGSTPLGGPAVLPTAFLAALTDPLPTPTRPAALAALVVAPNPARTTLTVQLPAGANGTLMLLDARGQVVRTQPTAGGTTRLSLAGLPAGLYVLRVTAGGATAARRLVVE